MRGEPIELNHVLRQGRVARPVIRMPGISRTSGGKHRLKDSTILGRFCEPCSHDLLGQAMEDQSMSHLLVGNTAGQPVATQLRHDPVPGYVVPNRIGQGTRKQITGFPKQPLGNRLGRGKGTETQQPPRGRRELLECDRQGLLDRTSVADRRATLRLVENIAFGIHAIQQSPIDFRRFAGCLQVAGRLLQGQWQATQILHERGGLFPIPSGQPARQEADALLGRPYVELHRRRNPAPNRIARGHDQVMVSGLRQMGTKRIRLSRVVEYQQPSPFLSFQPSFESVARSLPIRHEDSRVFAQRPRVDLQRTLALRAEPPHSGVSIAVIKRVFQRQLGLAHPAHAVERAPCHCRRAGSSFE